MRSRRVSFRRRSTPISASPTRRAWWSRRTAARRRRSKFECSRNEPRDSKRSSDRGRAIGSGCVALVACWRGGARAGGAATARASLHDWRRLVWSGGYDIGDATARIARRTGPARRRRRSPCSRRTAQRHSATSPRVARRFRDDAPRRAGVRRMSVTQPHIGVCDRRRYGSAVTAAAGRDARAVPVRRRR